MRKIILGAVAAAAIAAPVTPALLTSATAASAAPITATLMSANGPGPVNAYYWHSNGHSLGGPQSGDTIDLSQGYVAKATETMNNTDLTAATITINGTINGGPFADQNGGVSYPGPNMRVFFQGGSAGTDSNNPDGFMGQSWWADVQSFDLGSATPYGQIPFTMTVTATPADGNGNNLWSDWEGIRATDSPALFANAVSHVRQLGISFGGGYFYENGVHGQGTVTISQILVNSAQVNG